MTYPGEVVGGFFYKKDSRQTEKQIKNKLVPILRGLGEINYDELDLPEVGGTSVMVRTERHFTFTKFDQFTEQLRNILSKSELASIRPYSLYERGDEFDGIGYQKEDPHESLQSTISKLELLPDSVPKFHWEEEVDDQNNTWVSGRTDKPFGETELAAIYHAMSDCLTEAEVASLFPQASLARTVEPPASTRGRESIDAGTGTAKSAVSKGTAAKKGSTARPDEALTALLRKYGLSSDDVLAIFSRFGVNSLSDLKITKKDPGILGQLKEKLRGRPIVIRALDNLTIEAVENAIFYSEKPGAEEDAAQLADFFTAHDVLADDDKDKLLFLIRPGVASLNDLKAIKEKGKNDPKLKALTNKISGWNKEAGANFELITPAMVASALRGATSEVSPELKAFLKKKGLPAGTETELAEFGITSLEDLLAVKKDSAPGGSLDQLKEKLGNSGIRLAPERFDAIKADDIAQQIAEAKSPEAQDARQKSAELARAIEKVEELRARVERAADTEYATVRTEVEKQYNSVIAVIKDVCGAQFASAKAAAAQSKTELSALLSAAISNATAAKDILDGVEKVPRPLAKIIREEEMLCGFLISPAGAFSRGSEMVRPPEDPEQLVKGPGPRSEFSVSYKGSQSTDVAASTAQQASSALAAAAQTSAAFFAGSGVGAVSAAASYGTAQKESRESQKFNSATIAECGEVRYIYEPKQAVQFKRTEIRLNDDAIGALDEIAQLPADQQVDAILVFYEDYGSHFFLRYSLGGRYDFTAKGDSESRTGTDLLIAAVAQTTDWAASASGSYAGIGGAVTAAGGVKGMQSVASAQGDRFALNFESAKVVVKTEVVGGAGLAPRDVWAQSLRYNSTWAVIDRDDPIAVWQLVRQDRSLPADIKNLAPVLEKVWVRHVFLSAVQRSHPILYKYLKANAAINTAKALEEAVGQLDVEPEFNVTIVTATSEKAERPTVSTRPPKQGLKLIGGGAVVDMPLGQPGNLLFESYPAPESKSWIAAAKSHKWPSPQATVKAFGIYLEDPDDLWDVKVVSVSTGADSDAPEVTAILPPGYALTGGGAKITYRNSSRGLLLKESRPVQIQGEYRGWTVKGTDHLDPDVGSAEAFVIGIRPRNGAEIPPSTVLFLDNKERDKAKGGVYWPSLELSAKSSEEVVVGGGAATGYEPPPPSMLTASGFTPDNQRWFAAARTHVAPGSPAIPERQYVELSIWAVIRKGRLVPL